MITLRILPATLLALLSLAAPAFGGGPLVIVGGALAPTNGEVYRLMLAGRRGDGPLCLLATASAEPKRALRATRKDFRDALKARGETGDVRVMPIGLDHDHPGSADDPAVAERLGRCSGFFFTGGDPSRIVDLLLPGGRRTRAAESIYGRFERGALVAGTSAGAAMMSDPMIAGGSSDDALRHGPAANGDEPGVWLRPGMGFFPHGVIDPHGLERGRFGRLLVAIAHRPPEKRLGFGVGENTAIAVGANGLEAAGGSGVLVVDLEDARPLAGSGAAPDAAEAESGTGDPIEDEVMDRDGAGDPVGGPAARDDGGVGLGRGFEGGTLWLLGDGDYYESAGNTGGPEAGKPLLVVPGAAPPGEAPAIPKDPWQGDAFYRLLVAFAAAPPAVDRLTVPAGEGELVLVRPRSFQARARRDADGRPAAVFAGPFELAWFPSSRAP